MRTISIREHPQQPINSEVILATQEGYAAAKVCDSNRRAAIADVTHVLAPIAQSFETIVPELTKGELLGWHSSH